MKYIVIVTSVLLFSFISNAQQSPSEKLAAKFAERLKDSLLLTSAAQQSLYQVNLELHQQKTTARLQYSNSLDTLSRVIQQIENSRDSLYRQIIGEEKFGAYMIRKKSLINNN